jgi:hypothetical protein
MLVNLKVAMSMQTMTPTMTPLAASNDGGAQPAPLGSTHRKRKPDPGRAKTVFTSTEQGFCPCTDS